jgi:hypothetical protein
MNRFRDNGESLYAFFDHHIIACPSCGKPVDLVSSRIACWQCGYVKEFSTHGTSRFRVLATNLRLENYLAISCCGHTLWAVNLEHLDFLEAYVGAALRERMPNKNKSIASRLPEWMKDYKNREQILKCIAKLRQKLKANNYKRISNNVA